MIRLSACIETIFTELPFPERIGQVAEAGLPAFEFWRWRDKDLEAIARKRGAYRLEVAAMMVEPLGELVDPAAREVFINGVRESIQAARLLSCRQLLVLTGKQRSGVPRQEQHQSIVDSLREAAPLVEQEGITLLLEPLNTLVDHQGYYLSSSHEGYDILREVASPNVKLLYDIYHQQVTEGNLIANIVEHISLIGHFHVADVPGRNEPGTGEINYHNIFRHISETGYDGYVGLEFRPSRDSMSCLQSVAALAASSGAAIQRP